jgi:hypothetical protein
MSKRFNPLSLDALNFLLADVRGALCPFLSVFLVSQQHWSLSQVGVVTSTGGLLGLALQTPIGAAIDETRAKRGAIIFALVVLGCLIASLTNLGQVGRRGTIAMGVKV